MVLGNILGPSDNEQWKEISLIHRDPLPVSILCLPDANNNILKKELKGGYFYYLPKAPLLVKTPNGVPVLSIILKKSEPQQGNIIFEVTLGFQPPKEFVESTRIGNVEYVPLTASKVLFELVSLQEGTEKLLASFPASGQNAKAAFIDVPLSSSETTEVLSALNGIASKISIRAKVSYKVAPKQNEETLSSTEPVEKSITITAPLETVIGEALKMDPNQFIN
ncbi:hypothetical protein [Paenibacillus polymyxa]|uniref:hypothetical protein n=1 Tax=Paenibacillus polymyxa TaxID=1406 RepID=UPI0004DF0B64|nr:hypothetical protein [Paenibacillus polymyxa]